MALERSDKTVAILDASVDAPWVITPEEFNPSLVGSKSLNIAKLKSNLPSDVLTPHSVALPFGTMQRALHTSENARVLKRLDEELRKLSIRVKNAEAETIFEACRKSISSVTIPEELKQALEEALASTDKQSDGSPSNNRSLGRRPHLLDLWKKNGPAKCTAALVEVWSSPFALRPWVSLTKASKDYCELNMAVLVQVGFYLIRYGATNNSSR